jgi:hypothetical protein
MKTTLAALTLSFFLAFVPAIANAAGYIGAGANRASIDGSDFDDDDTTYSAALGLSFTRHVGIEIGYYDLGSFESAAGNIDNEAWTGALTLTLPFDRSSIYGKLGVARIDSAGTLFGIPFDSDETENFAGVGAVFGFGLIGIYIEWLHFDSDRDVDVVGAGIRFSF